MKYTKQQLLEVNQTMKQMLKEADYDPNSIEYRLTNLKAFSKAFNDYVHNKSGRVDFEKVKEMLRKQLTLLDRYKD